MPVPILSFPILLLYVKAANVAPLFQTSTYFPHYIFVAQEYFYKLLRISRQKKCSIVKQVDVCQHQSNPHSVNGEPGNRTFNKSYTLPTVLHHLFLELIFFPPKCNSEIVLSATKSLYALLHIHCTSYLLHLNLLYLSPLSNPSFHLPFLFPST